MNYKAIKIGTLYRITKLLSHKEEEEILQRAAGLLASVQALPRDNVSQKYVILYLPTLYESLAYKPPHNNDLKD